MALELNSIAPVLREKYIHVGRRYSSADTLEQASQTLNALATYGAALEPFGFMTEDTQRLRDARELLSKADVGREQARGSKRVSSAAYVDAFAAGKIARRRGRSVLSLVAPALHQAGAAEAAARVETVLQQTSRQSSSPKVMLAQLELLAGVLADTAVAAAAKKRAGKRTLDALNEAATALREADRATAERAGTTAETQEMDLLDGIIVELVRQARDVALAAAEELGNPAMARAFKLDRLYRSRRRSKEPIEDTEDEADDSDDTGA